LSSGSREPVAGHFIIKMMLTELHCGEILATSAEFLEPMPQKGF
jgi:hypothetical protein